eukprot:858779-Prorocentrum_minimum.AAC.1
MVLEDVLVLAHSPSLLGVEDEDPAGRVKHADGRHLVVGLREAPDVEDIRIHFEDLGGIQLLG